ncbi:MAG: TlpA family protein disulfide reductase [Nitrospinae bacterium]|nr:TlpA family protein disulfide reductase [Nitrospinota bacterium]
MKKIIFAAIISISFTFTVPLHAESLKWWEWGQTWLNSLSKGGWEGKTAPEKLGETLDGKAVSIHDYQEKLLFINFWATWCPPCKEEFQELPQLSAALEGEKIEILAVNIFSSRNDVNRFLEKYQNGTKVLFDADKSVGKNYGIHTIPTSFLVDSKGKVLKVWKGAQYISQFTKDIRPFLKSYSSQ